MKVKITRTAMIGGGLSYDVLVPLSEVSRKHQDNISHRIIQDAEYVSFIDAMLPASHFDLDRGWDRYKAFLDHEKAMRRLMLKLATGVFPELNKISGQTDELPLLWTCGLMEHETSSAILIDY